jgi:hypothetical protein
VVNAWKIILATLVIFGAGVITGGLIVNYSNERRSPATALVETPKRNVMAAREPRLPIAPNFLLRKEFLERLNRELDLSAEQRGRIEKRICDGQEQIKELSKLIEPDVQDVLFDTREKIRCELNEQQKALYTELLKKKPAKTSTNLPAGPIAIPEKTN